MPKKPFCPSPNGTRENRKPSWRPGTYREVKRHLLIHAKPLHAFPIAAVSQNDVVRLLENIARKSGGVTANRTRANLSALMGWIIRRGIKLPAGNVASETDKAVQEQARERVLADAELKAIWSGCLDDDYGAIIRLLVSTGCRANEIGRCVGMRCMTNRLSYRGYGLRTNARISFR